MKFNSITNPKTGKKYTIDSKQGSKILNNYISKFNTKIGGSTRYNDYDDDEIYRLERQERREERLKKEKRRKFLRVVLLSLGLLIVEKRLLIS